MFSGLINEKSFKPRNVPNTADVYTYTLVCPCGFVGQLLDVDAREVNYAVLVYGDREDRFVWEYYCPKCDRLIGVEEGG